MYYVYAYYEPDCVKPFYIGKGKGLRAIIHNEYPSSFNKNTILHRKLRKMKRQGIKPIIRILFDNLEEDVALELEILLIKKYGRRNIKTGCLCNMTNGGEGVSGRVGCNLVERSYDYRINASKARKGKKRPFECTKKVTDIHNEKYGQLIDSYDLRTKEVIKQYRSLKELLRIEKELDRRTIRKCLRGLRKSHNGVGWRYSLLPRTIVPIDLDSFSLKPFQ